jgi:hypothetical protein
MSAKAGARTRRKRARGTQGQARLAASGQAQALLAAGARSSGHYEYTVLTWEICTGHGCPRKEVGPRRARRACNYAGVARKRGRAA